MISHANLTNFFSDVHLNRCHSLGLLDANDLFNCMMTCKKIKEIISRRLLEQIEIKPNRQTSYYSQLVNHFRQDCSYFNKVFKFKNCKNLMEARLELERHYLSFDFNDYHSEGPRDYKKISSNRHAITKVWEEFDFFWIRSKKDEQDPMIAYDIEIEKPTDDKFSQKTNRKIHLLLKSGVLPVIWNYNSFGAFASIISQKWCTLETLHKLCKSYDYQFPVIAFLALVKTNRFAKHLTGLSKLIPADDYDILIKYLPFSHSGYILQNLGHFNVYSETIKSAIRRHYSEDFILKLLEKCPEIENEVIEYALENKYSERLINQLLSKCASVDEFSIVKALRQNYSADFILKLADKMPVTKSSYAQIDVFHLSVRNYPEYFTVYMMNKYQTLDHLDSDIRTLCENHYSEESILQLFNKYQPSDLFYFTIQTAIKEKYSEKFILKLLSKCSWVEGYTLQLAIEKAYTDSFILELLDKCPEIENDDILKAIESHSSDALILKLLSKCKEIKDPHYLYNIVEKALERKRSEKLIIELINKSKEFHASIISYAFEYDYSEAFILQLFARLLARISYPIKKIELRKEKKYSEDFILKLSKIAPVKYR